MPTSQLEINLAAIARNAAKLASIHQHNNPNHAPICAVLKQNAYGSGAVRVARALAASTAVSMLAVYSPNEARELAESAIATPILVLMPVHELTRDDPLYNLAALGNGGRLHLTAHSLEQLNTLTASLKKLGITADVHIQLDTGMARGGALAEEASQMVGLVRESRSLRLAGLMTHFAASATDPHATQHQHDIFTRWLEQIRPLIPPNAQIHAADTSALLRSSNYHHHNARVGQGLLGYGDETTSDQQSQIPQHNLQYINHARTLERALRWTSKLVRVSDIPPGWTVGYGATWRAGPTGATIGLIPVGYAEGYPRILGNRAAVRIFNQDQSQHADAPVVGRVSMDQMTVDLTALPQWARRAGATAEIYGQDRNSPTDVATLAKQADTILHELLSRLSAKLQRRYTICDNQPATTAQTTDSVIHTTTQTTAIGSAS